MYQTLQYVIWNKTRDQWWNDTDKKWGYFNHKTSLYSHDQLTVMTINKETPWLKDHKHKHLIGDVILAMPMMTF